MKPNLVFGEGQPQKLERGKLKQKNKKIGIIVAFMLPALLIYLTYVVYPIFSTMYYSLFEWDGGVEKLFVGFGNYIKLFQDEVFWKSLGNNFWVVFASVFFQIPMGLIMALLLFAPIKGIRFFSSIYFLPFLMSTVAIGILWLYMFDPINGVLNKLINMFGFENVAWLSDNNTALFSVLLVIVWQFAPFYMILFKAGLVGISSELYEAADIDGANTTQKFTKITLPLLMPTIISSSILAIVGSLKAFDIFYIMTGGGPNHATEIMGTYMYKEAFTNFNMGYASSIAFVMFIISLGVTIIILGMGNMRNAKEGS